MTELALTYAGTVLIAMEFIRKFTKLQALMGMLIGWPLSSFILDIEERGLKNWYEVYFKAHKFNIILRIIFTLILCLITLPLTIAFYVIWFIVLTLNSFHNWVNGLYFEGQRRYRPFNVLLTGCLLSAHKLSEPQKYAEVDEEKVIQKLEKTDIPILPIIGIILITIAFVLFIT